MVFELEMPEMSVMLSLKNLSLRLNKLLMYFSDSEATAGGERERSETSKA